MTPHLVLKKVCKILNTDVLQLSWIFSGYGDKGGDLQGVVFPLGLWMSSSWLSCLPTSWSTASQPSLEPHKILSPLLAVNDCRFLFSIPCFPLQVLEFLLLNRKPINLSIYLVKKFCIFPPYVVVGHVMNRNTFQFVLKSDSGNTCSYLPFSRQNSSGKMSWKFHENPSKTLNMMPIIIPEKNRYAPIIPEKNIVCSNNYLKKKEEKLR